LSTSSRRTLAFGLACFGIWLGGCFTEVGNAEGEQLIEAKFSIDYSGNPRQLPKRSGAGPGDSVTIAQFYLSVKEAEYHAVDSVTGKVYETHLWREDSAGLPVDFTGADTVAILPIQNVALFKAEALELECFIPKAGALTPDTLSFASFHDRGYIKGVFHSGNSSTPFLFALPAAKELHLLYSKQALESWYNDKGYICRFTFFGAKWMSGYAVDKAKTWADKTGEDVAVFDEDHNAALYQSLVDSFYKSFNTADVFATM
jgi:hypothetical protein